MTPEALTGIIYNAAVLLSLGVLSLLSPLFEERPSTARRLGEGVVIGLMGMAIIFTRWEIFPGVLVDARSVLLSVAGFYFGPIATGTAVLLTSGFRVYLGGAGTITGIAIILSSAGIGLLWRHFLPGRASWRGLFALGVATHVVMLLTFFSLPLDLALPTLRRIALPVLIIHPLATMLLGRLLDLQRGQQTALQEIRRSNQRVQGMLANAWDILALLDEKGRVNYASPPAKQILGYDPEELAGLDFLELVHPDDLQGGLERFQGLLTRPGGLEMVDLRLRHKAGHWVWTENAARNQMQNPNLRSVVVNTRDITEAREAREALAESEEMHRTLLEGIPDYVLRFDTRGRHTFASSNVEALTGIPAREFLGKTHRELGFPQDLVEYWEEKIQGVVQSGKPEQTEFLLETREGEVLLDWRLLPEFTPDGEVASVLSISRDITRERQAEEELRGERQRLLNVMEGTDVGTWEWNIQTGHAVFDGRWAGMLGYAVEELEPTTLSTWTALTHPRDLERAMKALREHLEGPADAYACEIRMKHRAGHWVWIMDRGKVTEWTEEGEPLRMFGTHIDITHQMESAAALEESEERFRRLAENAPDLIYRICLKPEPSFEYVSPAAERITGFTPEEHYEDPGLGMKLVHPDDRHLLEGLVVEEEISTEPLVLRWIRKDGRIIWTEQRNVPIRDGGGRVVALEGIARDITDRVEAERGIRQREEHQRSLLSSSPMAIFTLSREGVVRSWNPAAEEIFGWPADEVVGRPLPVIPEDDGKDFHALLERVWNGEVVRQLELERKRRDGSPVVVSLSAAPIRNPDGEPMGIMSVLADITEHRQAEEALEQERALLSQISRNSPVGISLSDAQGRYLFLNPRAEEILGVPASEALGKSVYEMGFRLREAGGDERGREESLVRLLQMRKGPLTGLEWELIRPDGGRVPLKINAAPLLDPRGEVREVVVIFEDVTQQETERSRRAQAEAELQQAQKLEAVGRLAGGVAHDFNNMLAVIMSATEMALPEVEEGSHLHEDLLHISQAAEHSADLTRQLLAFSRKQIIRPRVLDLNEVIQVQEKMLRRLIGEDIQVELSLKEDLWAVRLDPSQVDQILANLLVNARDAIPGVGSVTIETDNVVLNQAPGESGTSAGEAGFVLLSVTDTGSGMDRATRERIFEPFFTTKESGEGTGLGLSTVYGIVKQANGMIRVSSEPGQGTTFEILLPRFQGEKEAAREIRAGSARGTETILVVEDEAPILGLARRFLEDQGYTVMTARTPMEAIGQVHEFQGSIHLLLTDVVMPGMNGKQLQSRIVEMRPDIRTIFMSGYTADVIAKRGVLEEDVEFVQKPFTMNTLTHRVREVLDNR